MEYTTKLGLKCDIKPMSVSDKDTFMAIKKVMKAVGELDSAQQPEDEGGSSEEMMNSQESLMESFSGLISHMKMDCNSFTLGDVTAVLTILQTGDLPFENPTE